MMLRISILAFIFLPVIAWSQKEPEKPGTIYGNVISGNEAMPYASVSIYSSKDSSMVTGAITDDKGRFEFPNIPYGNYYARISFIGFENKEIKDLTLGPENVIVRLNDVNLSTSSEKLKEIEVTSSLPVMEYKIDKKVVNVEKQLTATSGTAVDVLQNVPSVQVSANGDVSLRGSSGFLVYIDGRPGALQGSEALSQIPAATIDRIEIITNPSAKYDADGTSGIINVITKKNRIDGLSGVVNGNVGMYNTAGGDFLLSYRKKKYNYFFGADYNRRNSPEIERIDRYTENSDTVNYTLAEGRSMRIRNTYQLKGGMEVNLGIRDFLSLSASGGYRSHQNKSEMDYDESTNRTTVINHYTSRNLHGRSGMFYNANMDYQHKFSKEEHSVKGQLVYNYRNANEVNDNELVYGDGITSSAQKSTEDGPGSEFRARLDYSLPFSEKSKMETGLQARLSLDNDTNKVYNLNTSTNEYEFQPVFSNSIKYKRGIYAIYGIYSGERKSWGYQAGLRSEYTDRYITKIGADTAASLYRWDFFPSVHLSYKLPKDHQMMVSYSRRIERPRSYYFEPFITWIDAYNVRRGNPNLFPEYIDSYELGYSKRVKKTLYSLEAYYRKVHNKTERIKTVYSENIVMSTFQNVGDDHSLGLEGMVSADVFKWWNADLMANLYSFRGNYNTGLIRNKSTNWNGRFNNTFYLNKSTQFQINTMYQSASISAQGRVEDFYAVNLAVKKTFMKNLLSFTVQASDIFKSARRLYTSSGPGFSTEEYDWRISPYLSLNVSYRINNYKTKNKNHQGNSSDEGDDF